MTSRREFLQIGLAATLPLAVSAPAGASVRGVDAPAAVPLYKVLYEVGSPASVAFARRAARHGVAVQAIDGDVTRFWYDDLYHRWRQGPAALAGLTTYGALFCLEQLAWDRRLRVVFRGRHMPAAEGARHSLEGTAAMLRDGTAALARPAWAEAIADLVTRCPSRADRHVSAEIVTPAATSVLAADGLYSWVIAEPPGVPS